MCRRYLRWPTERCSKTQSVITVVSIDMSSFAAGVVQQQTYGEVEGGDFFIPPHGKAQ